MAADMSPEEKADSQGEAGKPRENLPPVGEAVWVECGGYRTLAYRDLKGVWRTVAKNEEVQVTRVLGSRDEERQ